MEEKFKEIYEKVTDVLFGITKKFDGISNKIYEKTGKKINVGVIVIGIILFIFVVFIVKGILGWVLDFLFGR